MKYVLGIDQGGTKTAAIVMDCRGRILGAGRCSGAYHISDGIDTAMAAIGKAAEEACRQAGIPISGISAVGAGITGMDWPEDYRLLCPALERVTGVHEIHLFNDVMGAFYSGAPHGVGAVLCAGTGLNAAVCSPAGEEFVFGFYIDEHDQGGSALAQRAIRCAFQSEMGLSEPTRLGGLFLRKSGERNIDGLLHRFVVDEEFSYSIKDLVPDIVACAESGDAVAIRLLEEFASDISRYVRAGLQRFGMLDMETDVVLSGSVLKGSPNRLRENVMRDILAFAPNAHIVNARYEPVVGAAVAALKSKAGRVDRKMLWKNIAASAGRFDLERQ